ncbi:MAG: TrkA C-terminal domain-containing protein [Candidatus Bathyarchaeia archaeon]
MPHRFEKIEYKPIPARELLLEMKNLSELMIDLAYSAALFNDKDLAEDVLELEARVDTLAYLLEISIMVAARDARDAEDLLGVSTVASATDKISDAAADIAAIMTQNIGVHPIVSEIFEKVEEHLLRVKVGEDSAIVGKQIGELKLAAEMGVDIIAIKRNKDWIIDPKETERILSGDFLIARGAPIGIDEFQKFAEGKRVKTEQISVSKKRRKQFEEIVRRFVELKDTSELMIDLAYSSLLYDNKELAEEVQKLEEYVDKVHTDFELCVLSSGFKKDEVRGFLGLIRLGVVAEKIADAAAEIAEVVLRGLEPHPILKSTIEEAQETITHVCVTAGSPLVNKTIREARIPEETGMWVLAIRKGEKCIRPKPDSKIEVGDVLIASGYAEGAEDLKKLASP